MIDRSDEELMVRDAVRGWIDVVRTPAPAPPVARVSVQGVRSTGSAPVREGLRKIGWTPSPSIRILTIMDGRQFPVRASDTERDRALKVLGERVAEGRMSHDTFERRVDQVLRARSRAELSDIVHDLPPGSRVVDRLTGMVSSLSAMTARIESAWRAPRLPRFGLPHAGVPRVLVGRAPGCDFLLTDLSVSRFHAELRRADGHWTVSDLGSMNGTRVNGWRLTGPARVRPGDQIGFGNLTFVVVET